MDLQALIDLEKLQSTVVHNLTKQWADIIAMLPNLLGAIVIISIGFVFALILKKIGSSLLRRVGLDRISRSVGVSDVMEDAGFVRRPSSFAGKIIFWLVMFVFLVPAAETLGMSDLVNLFKGFILFLPKLIASLVILIFGMMFAQFLRHSITDKPSAIGSNSAKALGNAVYGIMVTVVVLIALDHLNIHTQLLHNIIMLVVAGIMLTVAISVGLGAREVAHNLLSGIYARESFKVGDVIDIDGETGTIKEVSTLSTIIVVDDEKTISIPNASLYRQLVKVSAS